MICMISDLHFKQIRRRGDKSSRRCDINNRLADIPCLSIDDYCARYTFDEVKVQPTLLSHVLAIFFMDPDRDGVPSSHAIRVRGPWQTQ